MLAGACAAARRTHTQPGPAAEEESHRRASDEGVQDLPLSRKESKMPFDREHIALGSGAALARRRTPTPSCCRRCFALRGQRRFAAEHGHVWTTMTAACAATRFARPSAGRMTTSAASPASPGCRAASATPRPTAWACAGVCGETAAGCSARHWCAPSRSPRFGGEQQAACPAAPAALQRARPATDLRKRDWMLLRAAARCRPSAAEPLRHSDHRRHRDQLRH
jgi:hypothetical protein